MPCLPRKIQKTPLPPTISPTLAICTTASKLMVGFIAGHGVYSASMCRGVGKGPEQVSGRSFHLAARRASAKSRAALKPAIQRIVCLSDTHGLNCAVLDQQYVFTNAPILVSFYGARCPMKKCQFDLARVKRIP
jgi:hypothetical protein